MELEAEWRRVWSSCSHLATTRGKPGAARGLDVETRNEAKARESRGRRAMEV